MSVTYHIRIKKDYASALIEDLQKADAVEVIEEGSDSNYEIPEWQKAVVMARLKESREFPERLISINDAEGRLSKLLSKILKKWFTITIVSYQGWVSVFLIKWKLHSKKSLITRISTL